ncbi:MAG: hypothetical protein WCQ50_18505 [Spirochaetota bacterium]
MDFASAIHLATGLLVGYPPCPSIDHFAAFMRERYKVEVVVGTHPIPTKYFNLHGKLGTWKAPGWDSRLAAVMADPETRSAYD